MKAWPWPACSFGRALPLCHLALKRRSLFFLVLRQFLPTNLQRVLHFMKYEWLACGMLNNIVRLDYIALVSPVGGTALLQAVWRWSVSLACYKSGARFLYIFCVDPEYVLETGNYMTPCGFILNLTEISELLPACCHFIIAFCSLRLQKACTLALAWIQATTHPWCRKRESTEILQYSPCDENKRTEMNTSSLWEHVTRYY